MLTHQFLKQSLHPICLGHDLPKNLHHALHTISENLILLLCSISNLLHVHFHLRPQIRLVEINANLLIHLNQTDTERSRHYKLSLLHSVLSLLNRFDVLVNRCVCTYTVLVHFSDQISFCERSRSHGLALLDFECGGRELLTFVELGHELIGPFVESINL